MNQRKGIIPLFLTGLILLLTACSPQPVELETASPPPSPTPTPNPEETDPPAWTGQAADFTGEWHRTEGYIACPSTIEIANQTETGFDFSVEAYHYSHTGMAGGAAYFTSENTAFWRNDDPFDDIATGCLLFTMENGSLQMDELGWLPFGMNVSTYGAYTLGEPSYYTNGVIESLGPDRISLLQDVVGEDYETCVGFPLSIGSFEFSEVESPNGSGLFLEGFVPTMGYQQKIYFRDDGAVWVQFAPLVYSGKCYTNRPGEDIPDFLLFEAGENS